jgi:hypothetical protein
VEGPVHDEKEPEVPFHYAIFQIKRQGSADVSPAFGFKFEVSSHAAAILTVDFPEAIVELQQALDAVSLAGLPFRIHSAPWCGVSLTSGRSLVSRA